MKAKKALPLAIGLFVVMILALGVVLFANRKDDTGTPTPVSSNIESTEPKIIAENLAAPWSIAFYGDVPIVSLRDSGDIVEIKEDGTSRVIGTVQGVYHQSEGGLLGLAVQDDSLYAYYTTTSDNRISRFTISGSRGNLVLSESKTILSGIPSASTHNGGRIAFGPDGKLYATAGDAGLPARAQDTSSLGGKILRLNPDGSTPIDNPFPNSLVYSYGHRNPQGVAWSPDGRMFASEFGQNTWDELNEIQAGKNYGWPNVEGIGDDTAYVNPLQQWATKDASPSGMTYLNGNLFIANLRGRVLRRIPIDNLSAAEELFKDTYGRLRDAVVAPDGTLWFLTNNTDGRGDPTETDDRIISLPITSM